MSTSLSTSQGVWLVAERELGAKLRSKSFIISTVILLVAVLAGVLWAGFSAGGEGEATPVAATSTSAALLGGAEGLEVTEVADRAEAEQLVADGEVDAAVIDDPSSPTGTTVIALDEAPMAIVSMLSVSPTVELLEPDGDDSAMRYLMSFAFAIVFMMAAMTFGTPITTSVIEEKQTRVVEILISAIPARVLLAGKVIGNTILAAGQILGLIAVAVVGLIVTGQTAILQALGAPVVWFAIFFLFGFVLLAAMFAAAGALVSRQEDAGPTLTPLIYLVMIPYFVVVFFNDNPVVMSVMSYVPFSAAIGMPVRLYFNEAQWWEPLVSLGILLVSCVLVVQLGAKIYERSLLKMGARVKFKDALRA